MGTPTDLDGLGSRIARRFADGIGAGLDLPARDDSPRPVTDVPTRTNEHGQPIGAPVEGWTPRDRPPRTPVIGRTCRVEPLDVAVHGGDLFDAFVRDAEGRNWTYLPVGPFARRADFDAWLDGVAGRDDPLFHAIVGLDAERAVGLASLMRIDPANGVIEVGNIHFSPAMQRTALATEAMYLLMRRAFDELGYRRYEWKCDALNAPSRRAAERLGFAYEGLFRQAVLYKGRSRDTAWYSIVDAEWPAIKVGFETWLAPSNFDAAGTQVRSLSDAIREARIAVA